MGCIGFRGDAVDADPVVIGAGCIGGGEVYRPFEGSTGGYPRHGLGLYLRIRSGDGIVRRHVVRKGCGGGSGFSVISDEGL